MPLDLTSLLSTLTPPASGGASASVSGEATSGGNGLSLNFTHMVEQAGAVMPAATVAEDAPVESRPVESASVDDSAAPEVLTNLPKPTLQTKQLASQSVTQPVVTIPVPVSLPEIAAVPSETPSPVTPRPVQAQMIDIQIAASAPAPVSEQATPVTVSVTSAHETATPVGVQVSQPQTPMPQVATAQAAPVREATVSVTPVVEAAVTEAPVIEAPVAQTYAVVAPVVTDAPQTPVPAQAQVLTQDTPPAEKPVRIPLQSPKVQMPVSSIEADTQPETQSTEPQTQTPADAVEAATHIKPAVPADKPVPGDAKPVKSARDADEAPVGSQPAVTALPVAPEVVMVADAPVFVAPAQPEAPQDQARPVQTPVVQQPVTKAAPQPAPPASVFVTPFVVAAVPEPEPKPEQTPDQTVLVPAAPAQTTPAQVAQTQSGVPDQTPAVAVAAPVVKPTTRQAEAHRFETHRAAHRPILDDDVSEADAPKTDVSEADTLTAPTPADVVTVPIAPPPISVPVTPVPVTPVPVTPQDQLASAPVSGPATPPAPSPDLNTAAPQASGQNQPSPDHVSPAPANPATPAPVLADQPVPAQTQILTQAQTPASAPAQISGDQIATAVAQATPAPAAPSARPFRLVNAPQTRPNYAAAAKTADAPSDTSDVPVTSAPKQTVPLQQPVQQPGQATARVMPDHTANTLPDAPDTLASEKVTVSAGVKAPEPTGSVIASEVAPAVNTPAPVTQNSSVMAPAVAIATPDTAATAAPAPLPSQMSQAAADNMSTLGLAIAKRASEGTTRFAMELHPADMGRVDVQLRIDRTGELTAHLSFDDAITSTTFRARESELREQLSQTGLNLGANALSFSSRAEAVTSGVAATGEARQSLDTGTQQGGNQNPNHAQSQFAANQDQQQRPSPQQVTRALAQANHTLDTADLDSALADLSYRPGTQTLALNLIV